MNNPFQIKPTRTILQGDKELAAMYAGEAKKMIFQLRNIQKTNQFIQSLDRRYEDGTVINVHSKVKGMDIVTIMAGRGYGEEKREEERTEYFEFPVPVIAYASDYDTLVIIGGYVAENFIGFNQDLVEYNEEKRLFEYGYRHIPNEKYQLVGLENVSEDYTDSDGVYDYPDLNWVPNIPSGSPSGDHECMPFEYVRAHVPGGQIAGNQCAAGVFFRSAIIPSSYSANPAGYSIKLVQMDWNLAECISPGCMERYVPYTVLSDCEGIGCSGTWGASVYESRDISSIATLIAIDKTFETWDRWEATHVCDDVRSGSAVVNLTRSIGGKALVGWFDAVKWEQAEGGKRFICAYASYEYESTTWHVTTSYGEDAYNLVRSNYWPYMYYIKVETDEDEFVLYEIDKTVDDSGTYEEMYCAIFDYNGSPVYVYYLFFCAYVEPFEHVTHEYGFIFNRKLHRIKFKGVREEEDVWNSRHDFNSATYVSPDGDEKDIEMPDDIKDLFGAVDFNRDNLFASKYIIEKVIKNA